MNVVTLTGRLTRDPEVRAVGDDNKVAKFGIALDGIKKDQVDFVDVETWGKSAEIVEKFFTKGSYIALNGRLKQDTWEDKESGKKNSKVFVVAERVEFGPKTDGGGDSAGGDDKPAAKSSGKSGGSSGSRRSVPVDDDGDIF